MLDERSIQLAIWNRLGRNARICVPNYTPRHWMEADVWLVSAAGYVTEYEIKITATDLRADFCKSMPDPNERGLPRCRRQVGKHEMLGDKRGPNRMFFVVPEPLVAVAREKLDTRIGIVSVHEDGLHKPLDIVRPAQRLHEHKVNVGEVARASGNMVYRYWDSLGEIKRLANEAQVSARSRPPTPSPPEKPRPGVG